MLKAIHAQEGSQSGRGQGQEEVVVRLRAMELTPAADLVEQKIRETLTYYAYPSSASPAGHPDDPPARSASFATDRRRTAPSAHFRTGTRRRRRSRRDCDTSREYEMG